MLFDAFATRSAAVFETFIDQLAKLCPARWKDGEWKPDHDTFIAAIQIVRSFEPRNEAEACLAAQAVAVHLATMKLGEQVGSMTCPDPRTVAILGKSARTYAMQLETMARLKGGRSSRQTIEVHHHNHQHVHFEGEDSDFGGQPQATGETSARKSVQGTGEPPQCAALPGPHEGGELVPVRGGEGEAGLPHARGQQGGRRTKGRS